MDLLWVCQIPAAKHSQMELNAYNNNNNNKVILIMEILIFSVSELPWEGLLQQTNIYNLLEERKNK